jgi:DNA helicase-2/ATP-dependent DNA helicase PcrA
MDAVAVGFSPSQFGDRLQEEIAGRCMKKRTGKPAMIQELARLIIDSPDHKGAAHMLTRLHQFTQSEAQFSNIKFDSQREFWDAIRLGQFDTPTAGLADLAHRRAYARAQPPARAISTIHKAKGLECLSVVVMPCDGRSFPDKFEARCLLYVALSRAKEQLMLVLSEDNPSPLFLD